MSEALLVEGRVVAGFGHDFRVLWDEHNDVTVWLDGEQVKKVAGVTLGAQLNEEGKVEVTKTVTLYGADHPLADILAEGGFKVLIINA